MEVSFIEVCMDQEISVTPELFKKYLSNPKKPGWRYVPGRELRDTCEEVTRELPLEMWEIATDALEPNQVSSLALLFHHAGRRLIVYNRRLRLEYLGSDRGGHYSTDYYSYLVYTHILVDSL